MSTITIRFITDDSLLSGAIRLVSRAVRASHVEFLTPEGTTIGAHADGGVKELPLDWCKPTWERRYEIDLPPNLSVETFWQFARSRLGIKYDFKDIAGLMLQAPLHSQDAVICSEFVAQLLQSAGVWMLNVLPDRDYAITPELLHLSPLLIDRCTYKLGE